MQMKILPLHEVLSLLAWLEGIWVTDEPAVGMYPNIKTFNYYDQINITSIGQPLYNYIAQSWHPDTGAPMHRETGFLQVIPGTNKIVLSLIDNIGIFTVEQGELGGDNKMIDLKSTNITITDASPPVLPTLTEVRLRFLYNIAFIIQHNRSIIFFLYRLVGSTNSMAINWNWSFTWRRQKRLNYRSICVRSIKRWHKEKIHVCGSRIS